MTYETRKVYKKFYSIWNNRTKKLLILNAKTRGDAINDILKYMRYGWKFTKDRPELDFIVHANLKDKEKYLNSRGFSIKSHSKAKYKDSRGREIKCHEHY